MKLNWMLKLLNERVTSGLAFVFLDACRDNEADQTFKMRARGGGPIRKGLCGAIEARSADGGGGRKRDW